MPYSFGKDEKLCSRKLIDKLYAEGHRLMAFPFSVQWMPVEEGTTQVMFVVPKRRFKHAVNRNRVRRLARECYRLRKDSLYSHLHDRGINIVISMVYVHNEIMSFDQMGRKMDKLIAALKDEI